MFRAVLIAGIAGLVPFLQQPASRPSNDAPWNIEDEHGPSKTVQFTTDEATWLHLDVSPDGRTLVFSILGDLYTLPIEGGKARRITGGTAFDVQPKFSRDGRWIAFASDRDGTENIWICDPEGKNLRQITTEKTCIVNGPAWSPDGDYIVGRKRLTDMSSIGTVELWMWHVRGGQGFAITKKDEQPDAAEPVFSNDGRYIYFSARDSRYRYSRNINEGIWQIKRHDRQTGQTVALTAELGGAAAPALSPDGKTLAFTRRVRAKTRIELFDLGTGAMRMLTDAADRDNQEGFCYHGTFPGYNWTPDGRSIVAPSGGKIVRFDVADGSATPIPFQADVEQRVADAVRFQQKAVHDEVRARMIRWPVETPDGKHLLFSALGHIYQMDIPGGTPSRLTTLEEFEYAPALSPDGSKVVFATFGTRAGSLQVVDRNLPGAAPKAITSIPAQYSNPSFSSDGSKIVYIKGSGVTLRGDDPANELWNEIHWIDAAGGDTHYVISVKNRGPSRRAPRPQFNRDATRIYCIDDEPGSKPGEPSKTAFFSVKLDGTDRKVHLRFERADEVCISPDEKWVAFAELNNAWVAAMPYAGAATVEIKADGGAVPVRRLTDEGGDFVQFTPGAGLVAWVSGPSYFRVSLDEAIPIPEPPKPASDGKAEKKDDGKKAKSLPKATEHEIVLKVPRARPTGLVAYVNARIITMHGDEVVENGMIVVQGDRIRTVSKFDPASVPAGAQVVDLKNATVMPGLFDEHAHLHYSTIDVYPTRSWKYLANLAYGVTSTHDPSATTHEVFTQAEMVEAGSLVGPRIYSTGYILYGADGANKSPVQDLDDARRHVRRMKKAGAFTVKSYMQPRRVQRQWVLQAAREEGVMVVPEGGGDQEMDMTFVLDGHTTVEHALPITPIRKDVATLFGRSGTAYTPTLLVAYGGLWGELWYYQHYEVWKNERLLQFVPQENIDRMARIRGVMATDEDWHHIDVSSGAKKILDAGGRVCLGAHGQMQGLGPHWEMWTLVQGGMTPLEAIRASTLAPAQTLGLDGDLGSLEAGKLADFMILAKNPLEKIENSDSVQSVVKNGVLYDPARLAAMLK
jgi:Tol biopolymer transport system component/imidazolonepropionase-like amidohydrolase